MGKTIASGTDSEGREVALTRTDRDLGVTLITLGMAGEGHYDVKVDGKTVASASDSNRSGAVEKFSERLSR